MGKSKYSSYENLYIDSRVIEELRKNARNEETLNFTIRLRECMYKKKLNQSDLASLTGISVSTLSPYFTATAEPKISTLVKISKVLDVSINYLLGEHDNISIENEGIRKIIGLNDDAIKTLTGIYYESQIKLKEEPDRDCYIFKEPYNNLTGVLNELLTDCQFTKSFLNSINQYFYLLDNSINRYILHSKNFIGVPLVPTEEDETMKRVRNLSLFELQNLLVSKLDNDVNESINNLNTSLAKEE